MADTTEQNLAAILAAGKRIGDPKEIDGGHYAVLGQGDRIENLEAYRAQPTRLKAKAAVVAHDTATFSGYFNDYNQGETNAVIFADLAQFMVLGILDYHKPEDPSWCEHRITYTAPRSPEWATWTGRNAKPMGQSDFAQFIEDNIVDIRTPPGAEMLEISRNLQAKKQVAFSSAIRLADGSQEFTYAEEVQGSSSKGKFAIPEKFTLGIPVFRGDQPYEVTARLRYRIDGGKLQLWYDLYRHKEIEKDAFDAIVGLIAEETAVEIWQGTPE